MNAKPEPAPAVTFTRTRRDINGQIAEKLAELGIDGHFGYTPEQGGRMQWTIGGERMTTGEAADKYLPGGFAGNFGMFR